MRWLRGAAVRRPALLWGVHHTDLRLTGSSRATRWIARACALMSSRVPDMIVCCAESARSSHRQGGYCPQRMTVIHNGIDLELFRANPACRETLRRSIGIELNAPLVGIVGRYHPVKDYGTFVAAMRVVLDAMPQCRFVMAGQDWTRESRTSRHSRCDADELRVPAAWAASGATDAAGGARCVLFVVEERRPADGDRRSDGVRSALRRHGCG